MSLPKPPCAVKWPTKVTFRISGVTLKRYDIRCTGSTVTGDFTTLAEWGLLNIDVVVTPVLLDCAILITTNTTRMNRSKPITDLAELLFLAGTTAAPGDIVGADEVVGLPHLEQNPCPSGIALAQLGQYM